jgi:HPt (histidine-containing phosphotransfer) domain-containing protein
VNQVLSVLDREQLRNVTLEDDELMREVLAALIDDTARQVLLLDQAIRQQNAGETIRLAHYSKGACANVGARSTAAILQHIERTAAQGDFLLCSKGLQSLATELDKLRSEAASV